MLKKTYIKILMERRVPHIIGSYIVAGISLVLFLDWLKVRYEYPEYYISLALFGIISIFQTSHYNAKCRGNFGLLNIY